MTVSRKIVNCVSGRFCLFNRLALLVLLTVVYALPAWAASDTISFLPLNVHSPFDAEPIQARTDSELRSVLATADIALSPATRRKSSSIIKAAWPPPAKVLQDVADKIQVDNLAVGNLTVIGNKISIDVKLFDLLAPGKPTFYFQTADSIEGVRDALAKIAAEIKNHLDKDVRIAAIAPEGNERIDSGAILRKIKTKPGDAYSPATLRSDLKEIYKMGYFDNVQIDIEDTPAGKKVVFRVIEKPLINSVTFRRNRRTEGRGCQGGRQHQGTIHPQSGQNQRGGRGDPATL